MENETKKESILKQLADVNSTARVRITPGY